MLKRFFNVIAAIVAVFVTPNIKAVIEAVAKDEVVTHWNDYSDDADEDFNFGPNVYDADESFLELKTRDEFIAEFILKMWEKYHVCLSKAEVEQMLDEMDTDDEYISASPHPVFLHQARNDYFVVGHTMRPQTASLAATRPRRQKIC